MSQEVLEGNALKVQQIAEEFQDDCHKCCGVIMDSNKGINYQDATNVWIFTKLAELQHQINSLPQPPK